MHRFRVLSVAALAAGMLVASTTSAQANTTKDFDSDYSMIYRVYGKTTFHVTGDGKVYVGVHQTSGASTRYSIRIEREVCGVFGCKWKDHWVGTECVRTISTTTPKSCNFTTGNSGNRHRVVLTKNDDKQRVVGFATVR